jgi:dolichol-phosphate mannosyltransferase
MSGRHRGPRCGLLQRQTNGRPQARVKSGCRRGGNDRLHGRYKAGADIIVKIDGDGQMDPRLTSFFVEPPLTAEQITPGETGFSSSTNYGRCRSLRFFGNSVLSFCNKVSSVYRTIFDPTNGFTAIHANVDQLFPLARISKRYFLETDMLSRLKAIRAVVVDLPMDAKYGSEQGSLIPHGGWQSLL